jgi:SNF2-related domain
MIILIRQRQPSYRVLANMTSLLRLSSFIHKLTREIQENPPNECRGGLLADEMGLGKSLSLLALIVHTLEEAQRFTDMSSAMCTDRLTRVGATLIVTPYSSEIPRDLC